MAPRALTVVLLLGAACSSSTPPAGLVQATGTSSGGATSSGSASSSTGAATSSGGTGSSSSGGGTTTGGSVGGTTSSSTSTGGSTTGGQDGGVTCVPGAMPDRCAALGLVCHGAFGVGTCGMPRELDPCNQATGCDSPDLSCDLLFTMSGIYLCLRSCNDIGDCTNPTTTCFDDSSAGGKICFYNVCGPDWPLPFPPLSGTTYYGPCSAQGDGGICLPVESAVGTVGVCLQGGPVASGNACAGRRVDGGSDQLCTAGTICAALNGAYACNPICVASTNGVPDGGGPGCASGSVCANVLSASFDFGQCLQSCNGTGICSGASACVPLSLTQSVCYP